MTVTSRARGSYAKTERVRNRILDASAEVFGELGYRATTMKQIAERAGISDGGLVHHFANKSELLEALLERHEAIAAERYTEKRPIGIEAFLTMLDVVLEDRNRPGIVELHSILSAEAASQEHPAHEHYRDRYRRVRYFIQVTFEQLEREGLTVGAMSGQDIAAAYIALSDGLQLQWLYDRDVIDVNGILLRFLKSVIPSFAENDRAAPGV
ncbi:TetR/AcrR family transcriptional regulator [Arthrobacter sp. Z4-13]